MKILLVEPGYKNKYPPIGLMKISTYHKQRGDEVVFVKGVEPDFANQYWDRIYITTLFTFDFKITIDTIKSYKYSVYRTINLYVGGILASLMPERIASAAGIPLKQILVGQLIDSRLLRFRDSINIDELPLDYDILDTITYKYPAGDNYISYLTRGCPNHCSFCAVPMLEPKFKITNNIKEQLEFVNKKYGSKQNLLLLDNNVLNAKEDLKKLIDDLCDAGFGRNAKFIPESDYGIALRRYRSGDSNEIIDCKIVDFLQQFKYRVTDDSEQQLFLSFLQDLEVYKEDIGEFLLSTEPLIAPIVEKYYKPRPKSRYVDFNQGVDARLINDDNMAELARLCIRPLRIAFDNIAYEKYYVNAVRTACRHGIQQVSNYLLFNYKDKPIELYQRIKVNIELNRELGINIFSFPMKYSPIDEIDRTYVGVHWNYKYLRAISAILNVTKGIVAAGDSFFRKAFGENEDEFFELLIMPRDMIMFRSFYENNGMKEEWKALYNQLTNDWKQELLKIVSQPDSKIAKANCPIELREILPFYLVNKKNLRNQSDQLSFQLESC